jgi:hypothetical protein
MAEPTATGPSVVGSGCGFALAGSGVGLLSGLFWFASEPGGLSPADRAEMPGNASYPYIELGIPVGVVVGAAIGIEYARRRQRAARRRQLMQSQDDKVLNEQHTLRR